MIMLIGLGINAVVLLMLFGVNSKLDNISAALRRLTAQQIASPETASTDEPKPGHIE